MRKILFLLAFIPAVAFAGSTKSTPLLVHKDADEQREFQNVYTTISNAPSVLLGDPTFTPFKQGDILISTTTGKVYIATSTASSGSWAPVN